MKDIVIKGAAFKTELLILLAAFVVAVLLNIYAIITRDGAFIELFTQIGWTIIVGVILYVIVGIIRLIIYTAVLLMNRKMKH